MYIIDNTQDLKRAIQLLAMKQSNDWYAIKRDAQELFLINGAIVPISKVLLTTTLKLISNALFTKATLKIMLAYYIKRATGKFISLGLFLIHSLQQQKNG
jgi:hypothetical protein